jgi:uncharacterized protein YvpB
MQQTLSSPIPIEKDDIIMYKRALTHLLAFLFYFTPISLITEFAEAIDTPMRRHISWQFNTYEEPDFQSKITGRFSPQYITAIELKDNGWALINTYKGEYWAYLNGNKTHVNHTFLYDNKGDKNSVSSIRSQVVRVIEQEKNWIKIDTWIGESVKNKIFTLDFVPPTAASGEKWINLSLVLLDVPIYDQRALGYPTGCEVVALAMMINYTVEADIHTLFTQIPYSRNPREGYRGNPKTTGGFTILPQALTNITKQYMGSYHNMTGGTLNDLRQKLNANAPVVVWVVGLGFNVHAVVLTGYDENGFYYNDPWTGKKNTFITYDNFYDIWNKSIRDRLLDVNYLPRKAISY